MASLRGHLLAFWLLLLSVCLGLGIVMMVLYRNSAGVQTGQARELTRRVCESIALRYGQSQTDTTAITPNQELLHVILQLALVEVPHVEGGAWSRSAGFVAYAYPTYEGGGVKSDVPEAERAHIADVANTAIAKSESRTDIVHGSREALVLTACPLPTPAHDVAVWTMTRVSAEADAALRNLRIGLGVLLAVVLVSGVWLGGILARGYRQVRRLEQVLGDADTQHGTMPQLALTGVEEFDRIVIAMNRYGVRLDAAQQRAQSLQQQHSRDQRLTALGRMTAGIAHEIRNPIATMRLKAENSLAATPDRHADALRMILGQVERLDQLVQNLLAIVQPLQLHIVEVDLPAWVDERRLEAHAAAQAKQIRLTVESTLQRAFFDPVHLGRAVDNLLENAVRHTPAGGSVGLVVSRTGEQGWSLRVSDDGPGVSAALRDHLFEPFATSRPDGTGLGLALVREVALAHGGEVHHRPTATGACFEIELPWRTS